jgi:hypothetical protein
MIFSEKPVSAFPDHAPHSSIHEHGAGLNFPLWREEDFMWRCGNDFGVIPRSFDDQKETSPPHCSREH